MKVTAVKSYPIPKGLDAGSQVFYETIRKRLLELDGILSKTPVTTAAAVGTATSGGYGFVSAAEFNNLITLVGKLRQALLDNGIVV